MADNKNIQVRLMAKEAANLCHAIQACEQVDRQSVAQMMSLLVELENFITHDAIIFFIDPSREFIVEWASERKRDA